MYLLCKLTRFLYLKKPLMIPVTKAAGHHFYHLDLAVYAFRRGIGNAMFEVGHDIVHMPF